MTALGRRTRGARSCKTTFDSVDASARRVLAAHPRLVLTELDLVDGIMFDERLGAATERPSRHGSSARERRLLALPKLLQHKQILPWRVVDEHPDSVLMGRVVDRSE